MQDKTLAVSRTVYPLDYDNNYKAGLSEWRQYVRSELQKSIVPAESAVILAKKILTQDSRYISPVYQKRQINGDRVVYIILFIVAIATAIIC